jgi:HEPN domain-containing protein
MEMSVEIAFKAVLRSLSIEFPKVHDITDAAREYLSGNGKLPGGFREGLQDYIATFNSLLGYRPIVGYGFDERFQNVDFEEKAKRLLPKSKEVVLACEAAIKKMRR